MFARQRYHGMKGTRLQLAIAILAGLDFLLFGYDQANIAGALTLPSFVAVFPEINTVADKSVHRAVIQGVVVGAYTLGCFFGAIATIFIGNPLGRRKSIFLGSSVMIVGATIMSSAFSLPQFIVGRLITGFGNGICTSTVPTWQSECSKAHRRGMMVMIEGSMIVAGVCLAYWISFGFFYLDPSSVSWRFPLAFQIFLELFILAFILDLPESPRWLILKGEEEEALSVLSALSDLPVDDLFIQNEFIAIKEVTLETSKGSFRDLFTMTRDRNFHRVVLGYVNQAFQQLSGINLITFYALTIYQTDIGLSPFVARLLGALNGTEYFMASWVAIFVIEKFGRRPLMLFGAAGQCMSMTVLAISTYFAQNSIGGSSPGIVAAIFLFVFNSFFAIGWLGMTWLVPAEIVPLRIRAPANAVSTSANWLWNWLVVLIVPISFAAQGYKTYIIFAAINAFIFPVVYFCYPETAYRSLEEMDTIFHKTTNIFDVVKVAKTEPHRYGKNGEILINYLDTDEHRQASVSAAGLEGSAAHAAVLEKARAEGIDKKEDSLP